MLENSDQQKPQLSRIFQMMSLNSFGLGFISIFIPVYLLQLGYSIPMVMSWFIIQDATFLIMMFLVVYISNKIGLVHCLQIRFVLLLSNLLLMLALPSQEFLFFFIPILIGADTAFFWIPLNILFLRNTKEKTMGESFSKLSSYPRILSMLCPLIGAYIITRFNFGVLFTLSLALVFIASIPLWPLRSEKTNFIFSGQSVFRIWHKNKRFFLPEVISSFAETGGMILTLFIYIKLLSVTQIGIVGTIASFTGIFFTLTIGKLTDKWNMHKLIKISAIAVTIVWVFCFFVGNFTSSPWLFYIATISLTLSVKAFIIPYQSLLFNSGRDDDAQFLVLREIPNVFGRLILYLFAALFYLDLTLLFLLSAFLFLYFWILDSKKLVASPLIV